MVFPTRIPETWTNQLKSKRFVMIVSYTTLNPTIKLNYYYKSNIKLTEFMLTSKFQSGDYNICVNNKYR